jgi:hypothetical protein
MAEYTAQTNIKAIEPIFDISNNNTEEEENAPIIPVKAKKEILWNVINSFLAGGLVLLGSVTANQELTLKSILISIFIGGIAAITQFKNYWDSEKIEYCPQKTLFSFF